MKKVTWCVIYQFTNLPIAFKICVVSISNKVAFSTKNFTFQTKPKYIPNLVFAAKKLGKSHHASVVCVPTHLWFLLNCILKRMSLSEISGWYSNCSSTSLMNNKDTQSFKTAKEMSRLDSCKYWMWKQVCWFNAEKWAHAISKIIFILGWNKFLACLECIRS